MGSKISRECAECKRFLILASRDLCQACYRRTHKRAQHMIVCSRCNETKPKQAKGMCRPCYWRTKRENKDCPAAPKAIARSNNLLYKFGVATKDYENLLASQDGHCACCSATNSGMRLGTVRALCIDHDHDTGQVRGLLCSLCNSALGYAKDSPEQLEKLAAYIRSSRLKTTTLGIYHVHKARS